ncbi:TIGR01777 family oxidoreductase [Streptomyces sp. SID5643]|uniref:TIGR01777 family oxidoreductase n=1 Tax=Streptomyces sp. SID5643 TaxID=2690307 RepID=UPI00136BC58E|nr:TIGR01777 family oxidoreductase [Streptomyces sp. SID5643]MZF86052.1 TIGR01777 family protein [Streptomyces sp. SID5643]MZF87660.1 TIGR01777 family protein [Streptomyces sp. SID5643]
MRVAITGSTGLIGSALTHSLLTDGHQVVRLVRDRSASPAGDGTEAAHWDPVGGHIQPGALDTVDAVVHLAGAGVGDKRWSAAYKEEIRRSRVRGTRTIARACAASSTPPRVLVSASATGYYGDTGDRTIEESAPPGDDFLAAVCVDWEDAADAAREAGIRVVHPRTGLVVSAAGGAFGRLFPLFRFGLGGRLGSGDQYWPFVSLTDHIRALRFAIDDDTLTGPVNFTAPEPLTNREITRAMGRALHRPTIASVPAFALRAALGEFTTGITGSCRAVPAALNKAGFTFGHPTIDEALRSALHTS